MRANSNRKNDTTGLKAGTQNGLFETTNSKRKEKNEKMSFRLIEGCVIRYPPHTPLLAFCLKPLLFITLTHEP